MDSKVTMNTVVAWLAWALTFALIAMGYLLNTFYLSALGLALSAAAATLHIRCFIIGLSEREVQAFEIGRQSVRQIR